MAKLYVTKDLPYYLVASTSLVASLRYRYTESHQKAAFTWTSPQGKNPNQSSKRLTAAACYYTIHQQHSHKYKPRALK